MEIRITKKMLLQSSEEKTVLSVLGHWVIWISIQMTSHRKFLYLISLQLKQVIIQMIYENGHLGTALAIHGIMQWESNGTLLSNTYFLSDSSKNLECLGIISYLFLSGRFVMFPMIEFQCSTKVGGVSKKSVCSY